MLDCRRPAIGAAWASVLGVQSDGFETLAEAVVDARQKVKANTVQMPDILREETREENSSTNGN